MKKTLTLLSLVGILAVAAFFLFDGIETQHKVSSVKKMGTDLRTNQDRQVSKTSPSGIKNTNISPRRGKSLVAKHETESIKNTGPSHTSVRNKFVSNRKNRMKNYNKSDMPDMFAKIQKMIRTREGFSEPTYQPNYKLIELKKMMNSSKSLKKIANLNWVERGPANVGGRTRGIVVDPDDPFKNTWYAGSVGGGVWKTTNAGTSWHCLTDGLPNLATTAIAQAQSNKNVLYVGTGEGFFNADAIAGDGIFKSTDRGETWFQLPATTSNKDFSYVNRVVVDPSNENVIVVGTGTGIFKSVDGGTSWTKKSSFGNIQHVIANPLNFKTLYAAANGKGVVKSFDAGDTWFETDNKNLGGGRMEIAIALSDTSKLYVSSDASSGPVLFGTIDGGTKWIEVKEKLGKTIDWLGGQGWYDNTIAVNPYDADLVYVGGIDLWKMQVTRDSAVGISSIDKDSIEVKFSFSPTPGLPFENGGVGTGNDYWKTEYLSPSDFFNVELRFGPGKGQKAARFKNATMDYQDYLDVPFEAWDITHNRQLMISFQDINSSGGFNLTGFNGDKIHIHNVDYNAAAPDVNITKTMGIKYKNNFVVGLRNASGVTWNPATIPNAILRINVGYLASLLRNSAPITDGYNQYTGVQANIHVDQHNIVCVPMDEASKSFKMINGNDGGLSVSTDGGTTFKEVGDNGYNTTQFYGVDKMTGAQAYFGGTQDNGTWYSNPSVNANATTKYQFAIGGDGFEVVWNFKDPLKMIGGAQYNNLSRTVDGWKTSEAPTKGFDDYGNSTNSPFITKIAGSKQDPDLLFVISRKGVYRSDNFAENWVLTPITTSFQSGGYFTLAQVTISTATPQVVWAGAYMGTDGKVQVSKDGGLSFIATNNYSKAMGLLTGLDTHPTEPATAYAVFSMQGASKILRTTNYGGVWTDITGFTSSTTSTNGFPDVATYCVQVMPYNTNIIWAGTEIGIIESIDNGFSWHYSNNGFPAASVWDMKIVDDEVVVATHGRGIWSVALPELANYTPLAATLSPRINGNIYQGQNGIVINASLRSQYDSTQVLIDGLKQFTYGATTIKDSTLIVPFFTSGLKTFQLVSFKGGVGFKSGLISTTLIEILAARNGYVNDFNSATTDFSGDFEIKTVAGFSNGAIHSAHPYGTNKDLIYTLRVPIIVAATNATLQYDDIAIVEPGDPGSIYGDNNFYDYVIVEASKGGDWFPLLSGYDCRSDSSRWFVAFNSNASGNPSMFKTHSVSLRDHFNAGDEILIRFRLFTDQYVDGWGWAIDNLKIQEALVGVEKETVPTQFELAQNYPNPFNPSTIIKYSLPKEEKVMLKVYNNVGELVATLVNEVQPAGARKVTFNAGRLASGVYFYKIEAGAFSQTKKLILMK